MSKTGYIIFNAAQPGVGRVQVLGSKKFSSVWRNLCQSLLRRPEVDSKGAVWSEYETSARGSLDWGYPDGGYPDWGYPDRGYPDRGYPDWGYPLNWVSILGVRPGVVARGPARASSLKDPYLLRSSI